MTEPEPLEQLNRTYVRFKARKLSYFSGCDYFRLASHPKVLAAARTAIGKYGLNVAASRMTTGNHPLYGEVERELMRFFAAEDALLVSTGYLTNQVVAQALAGQFSHALIDRQAHPSLQDAARFLDCPLLQIEHRDAKSLAASLQRCGPGAQVILLTDGMFSRDGSTAPLGEYLQVLPRDGVILVDDAHGAGVLGRKGKGTLEHEGVGRGRIIQTITLSKAFGAYGGAILSTKRLRHRFIEQSQLFTGSTPVPLPMAQAAWQSIQLLRKDPGFRRRLQTNSNYVKSALRTAGWPLAETAGPMVNLIPNSGEAAQLRSSLLAAGIYPPFIKYPGGPMGGYFRFVISSEHTRAQLDRLLDVLRDR